MVRIYEVMDLPNMDKKMESKHAVASGTTYPNKSKTQRPNGL